MLSTAAPIRYSHAIGQLSQSGAGFNNPVDVAAAPDGRLYVLNRSNMSHAQMGILRVTICTVDEEYLGQFATFGEGDGQFVWPTAIAVDAAGRIYVADEERHDVQVFDRDGAFLAKFGGVGSDLGRLNRPAGLAVDRDGNPLASDTLNNRIQRFSPDGRPLGAFGSSGSGEGQLSRPAGVGVDSRGAVYVSDYGNDRLVVFEPDGRPLTTLYGEATMTRWAAPFVAADPEMTRLRTENAEAVRAQEERFEGPIGIAVDAEDRVVIADCCKHRLQVYRRVSD